MDEVIDRATTCRRSPAVALVRMASIPFERRSGSPARSSTLAATRVPGPIERTVTQRRGGFGQLGDAVSLDDRG